jgi:hypothetical protein
VSRRLALDTAIAVALTAATFHPLCNLAFRCGCAWFFAGGAAHCDVNHSGPPDCPACTSVVVGGLFSAALVAGAFLLVRGARRLLRPAV